MGFAILILATAFAMGAVMWLSIGERLLLPLIDYLHGLVGRKP